MAIVPKNGQTLQDRLTGLRTKTSSLLNSATAEPYNPYIGKDGNLINPYINYQKILDGSKATPKAKNFISDATGLQPSNAATSNDARQQKLDEVNVIKASMQRSGLADVAQSYIGTPYVWGGESMEEGGMDCSGFVYNALRDAGYNYGRTTAQGYRSYGTLVNKADMQPGDLIFYGKNGRATHIGIYIGNGQMVHSAGGSKNTKSNPGKGVSVIGVDHRSDFLEARRY